MEVPKAEVEGVPKPGVEEKFPNARVDEGVPKGDADD